MRFNLPKIQAAVTWRARRFLKYFRQAHNSRGVVSLSLFVVGCQRSGTNMLVDVLDKSLETWIYNESNPDAFDNYRIKSFAEREKLIRKANCKWVVFKSLTDTQNIDRLLDVHSESKSIWVYRRYQDVTNSAVKKWQKGQLILIRSIVTKPDWNYWLVERMSDQQRALVRELYHPDMSWHSAGALKWYLRNIIFFDYHLNELTERVRLVQYESMVSSPSQEFENIFRFLGVAFTPEYISSVNAGSINREIFPLIDPRIRDMCEELQSRLDQAFRLQAN